MKTTIYDKDDNPIGVIGVYHKGSPGKKEFGMAIEPDDPDEVEVIEVFDKDGNKIDLTKEQEEEAIEQFLNNE